MTKHFTKELNTDNQKKSHKFVAEMNAINEEVKQLREQQSKAQERIPQIKEGLTNLVTDVEVITNEGKRKKVLTEKRKLQDELDELELFAAMNIETYKTNKMVELYELGQEAHKELREYQDKAKGLLDEARAEFKEKETELHQAMNYTHPLIRYEKVLLQLRNNKRTEEIKKERENENKKVLDYNGVAGTFKWGS